MKVTNKQRSTTRPSMHVQPVYSYTPEAEEDVEPLSTNRTIVYITAFICFMIFLFMYGA